MKRVIGIWQSWALVVGTMIGSGIFLLPSVLAPYGNLTLFAWIITAAGTLLIVLTLGSLSSTIDKEGGPYAYCLEVLGPTTGFMIGWGHWISAWVAVAASSVAFAGYASILFPAIEESTVIRTILSIAMVWLLGGIFTFGMKGVSTTQMVSTVLKLIPLLLIPGLGFLIGEQDFNFEVIQTEDDGYGYLATISKVVLITMWAFIGVEVATIPSKQTINSKTTIPKALLLGLISVTFVYIFATFGVWSILPAEVLGASASPFADAAQIFFGDIGASLIAVAIMISIFGSTNGCMVGTIIVPKSMSDDGLFPTFFSDLNKHDVAWKSLLVSLFLITLVLLLHASDRLVKVYELLIILSTLSAILPYATCAVADLYLQIKDSGLKVRPVSFFRAVGAFVFSVFMIFGAGLTVILYGIALLMFGLLIYYSVNRNTKLIPKRA